MKAITDKTAVTEIVDQKRAMIVKFEARWCQPCKAMTPVLEAIEADLGDAVTILTADVEQCAALAQKYRISQIPALVAINNGEVVAIRTGAGTRGDITSWITSALPDTRRA